MKTVRGWKMSLSTQLVVLLTLALLPLGFISVYQTWALSKESDALAARALLAEAENAAAAERKLLYEAVGSAEVIASAVGQTPFDPDFCSLLTRQFIASQNIFVWAGVLEINGNLQCSSNNVRLSISDDQDLIRRAESGDRGFLSVSKGRASGQSVLVAYAPTLSNDRIIGLTAVSIPHNIANGTLTDVNGERDFELTTLNNDGDVLSSSLGLTAAEELLPRDLNIQQLASRRDTTFEATSVSGDAYMYAVSELISDEVILVGSRPIMTSQGFLPFKRNQMALIFPILMWAASLAVALFGLHRLVLRHLRNLRSAMRRFALGERDDPLLDLADAPPELEEAQRAFNRMVMILTEAEARTMKDLQEKSILLREVHHRVKNNLQMVASIMNLQMRKAQTGEAKQVLLQLQNRVRGLATIHRTLFTSPELTTVNGGDLVRELIEELRLTHFAASYGVELETKLVDVPLYPDQAVPLSMFLSEAMTNTIKYTGVPDGYDTARILIEMSMTGDQFRLVIENTLGETVNQSEEQAQEGNGIGSRLMQAFVNQLEGTLRIEETEAFYRYELTFTAQDAQAQERVSSKPSEAG